MSAAAKPQKNVRLKIKDGEETLWGFQNGDSITFNIGIGRGCQRNLFGPEIDQLRLALARGEEGYVVMRGDTTVATVGTAYLTLNSDKCGSNEVELDDDDRAELQRALDAASDATAAGSRAYLAKSDARPHIAELQRQALASKAATDALLTTLRDDRGDR